MRTKEQTKGYQLWLSANDTYNWAHKAGASWPCSTLSNHRVWILVDENGLLDITLDGKDTHNKDIDGTELDAIVSDFLPESLHQFWPVWKFDKV